MPGAVHLHFHPRIYASLFTFANKTSMAATTSTNSGAFTTIQHRVSFQKEIKKSKFIAIASPISDDNSAMSFLSQVRDPKATHNCWAYKALRFKLSNVGIVVSLPMPQSGLLYLYLVHPVGFMSVKSLGVEIPNSFPHWLVSLQTSCIGWKTDVIYAKVGDQYRSNDDGEPSGTAGKPIHSAITSSGIDRVMVVVIRYFGGIKLGTGGLVRAYGGVASECLRNAPTCLVKTKVPMGVEVPFDLLGVLYHQLQSFHIEDMKQDYDTGKDDICMVTFKVDFDQAENLEDSLKANCSRELKFYKR